MEVNRKKKITIVERRGRGFVVEYRDAFGRRPRPTFKTQQEAEAHVEHLKAELGLSEVSTIAYRHGAVTIQDSIKEFLNTHLLSSKGKKTAQIHFDEMYRYLRNEQRIVNLEQVQLLHLNRFRAHLLGVRKLSPNTVRRMFATYSSWLNSCVSLDLIAKSPMTGFKKPREVEANIKTWTAEQIQQVFASLPQWALDAVYFIERTGVRPVDIERLKWSDVDLLKSEATVWSFKGGDARRDVLPLPCELSVWLVARKNATKPARGALVFKTPKGNAVTADSLQDAVRRAAEALGFDGLTVYGLRHTFAESLVSLNVHPRDIQLLMRHKKFETTTRYTKRNKDELKRIAERRSEFVSTLKTGHKLVTAFEGQSTKRPQTLVNIKENWSG